MKRVEYRISFERTLKKLIPEKRIRAKEAVKSLLLALDRNEVPAGLGLKRLYGDNWEIRVDLDLRVCFRMSGDSIAFSLVGSHNDIRNHLKNL